MTRSTKLALSALMAFGLLGGTAMQAAAQQDMSGQIVPSLEYQQADVREALRALFKDVGVSYLVAPEVQGTVTVSLKNVTFSAALENILRQVDSTYRIEGGVYQIVHREDQTPPVDPNKPDVEHVKNKLTLRRIPIRHADPEFIARMISGSSNFSGSFPEISSITNFPGNGSSGGSGSGLGSGNGGFGTGASGSGRGTSSGFGGGGSFGGGGISGGFGGGGR